MLFVPVNRIKYVCFNQIVDTNQVVDRVFQVVYGDQSGFLMASTSLCVMHNAVFVSVSNMKSLPFVNDK